MPRSPASCRGVADAARARRPARAGCNSTRRSGSGPRPVRSRRASGRPAGAAPAARRPTSAEAGGSSSPSEQKRACASAEPISRLTPATTRSAEPIPGRTGRRRHDPGCRRSADRFELVARRGCGRSPSVERGAWPRPDPSDRCKKPARVEAADESKLARPSSVTAPRRSNDPGSLRRSASRRTQLLSARKVCRPGGRGASTAAGSRADGFVT